MTIIGLALGKTRFMELKSFKEYCYKALEMSHSFSKCLDEGVVVGSLSRNVLDNDLYNLRNFAKKIGCKFKYNRTKLKFTLNNKPILTIFRNKDLDIKIIVRKLSGIVYKYKPHIQSSTKLVMPSNIRSQISTTIQGIASHYFQLEKELMILLSSHIVTGIINLTSAIVALTNCDSDGQRAIHLASLISTLITLALDIYAVYKLKFRKVCELDVNGLTNTCVKGLEDILTNMLTENKIIPDVKQASVMRKAQKYFSKVNIMDPTTYNQINYGNTTEVRKSVSLDYQKMIVTDNLIIQEYEKMVGASQDYCIGKRFGLQDDYRRDLWTNIDCDVDSITEEIFSSSYKRAVDEWKWMNIKLTPISPINQQRNACSLYALCGNLDSDDITNIKRAFVEELQKRHSDLHDVILAISTDSILAGYTKINPDYSSYAFPQYFSSILEDRYITIDEVKLLIQLFSDHPVEVRCGTYSENVKCKYKLSLDPRIIADKVELKSVHYLGYVTSYDFVVANRDSQFMHDKRMFMITHLRPLIEDQNNPDRLDFLSLYVLGMYPHLAMGTRKIVQSASLSNVQTATRVVNGVSCGIKAVSYIFGFVDAWVNKPTDKKTSFGDRLVHARKVAQASDGMASDIVTDVSQWVSGWFGINVLPEQIAMNECYKLTQEIEQLLKVDDLVYLDQPFEFVSLQTRIRTIKKEMTELTLKMKDSSSGFSLALGFLKQTILNAEVRISQINAHFIALGTRVETAASQIFGSYGSGKTKCVNTYISDKLSTRLKYRCAPYSMKTTGDFALPYLGEPIVIHDEFLQKKDEDPLLEHINVYCSTAFANMEGASLENKVMPFRAHILFAISNEPHANLGNKYSHSAIEAMYTRLEPTHFVNLHKKKNDLRGEIKYGDYQCPNDFEIRVYQGVIGRGGWTGFTLDPTPSYADAVVRQKDIVKKKNADGEEYFAYETSNGEKIIKKDDQNRPYIIMTIDQYIEHLISRIERNIKVYQDTCTNKLATLLNAAYQGMKSQLLTQQLVDEWRNKTVVEYTQKGYAKSSIDSTLDTLLSKHQIQSNNQLQPFVVGLYGPSGSGKTTMARKLAREMAVLTGRVVLEMKSIHQLTTYVPRYDDIVILNDLVYDEQIFNNFYDLLLPGQLVFITANISPYVTRYGSQVRPGISTNTSIISKTFNYVVLKLLGYSRSWTITTPSEVNHPGTIRRLGIPNSLMYCGESTYRDPESCMSFVTELGFHYFELKDFTKESVVPSEIVQKLHMKYNNYLGTCGQIVVEPKNKSDLHQIVSTIQNFDLYIKVSNLSQLIEITNDAYKIASLVLKQSANIPCFPKYDSWTDFEISVSRRVQDAPVNLTPQMFAIPTTATLDDCNEIGLQMYSNFITAGRDFTVRLQIVKENTEIVGYMKDGVNYLVYNTPQIDINAGAYAHWKFEDGCYNIYYNNGADNLLISRKFDEMLKLLKTGLTPDDVLNLGLTGQALQKVIICLETLRVSDHFKLPLESLAVGDAVKDSNSLVFMAYRNMCQAWQKNSIWFKLIMFLFTLGTILSTGMLLGVLVNWIISIFRTPRREVELSNPMPCKVIIRKDGTWISVQPGTHITSDMVNAIINELIYLRQYDWQGQLIKKVSGIEYDYQGKTPVYEPTKVKPPKIQVLHTLIKDKDAQVNNEVVKSNLNIMEQISANRVKVSGAGMLYGVGIKQMFVLCPAHIIGKHTTTVTVSSLDDSKVDVASVRYVSRNMDLAILELRKGVFNQFKDITKYIPNVGSKRTGHWTCNLVRKYKDGRPYDVHVYGTFKSVTRKFSTEIVMNGENIMLKTAGAEELSGVLSSNQALITTIVGDCGSPYYELLREDNKILAGLHCAGGTIMNVTASPVYSEWVNSALEAITQSTQSRMIGDKLSTIHVEPLNNNKLRNVYVQPKTNTEIVLSDIDVDFLQNLEDPPESEDYTEHFDKSANLTYIGYARSGPRSWNMKPEHERVCWYGKFPEYDPNKDMKNNAVVSYKDVEDTSGLLKSKTGKPSIMLTQIFKVDDPIECAEDIQLRDAFVAARWLLPVYDALYGKKAGYRHRPLTDLEAINGLYINPRDALYRGVEPINRDGSAGFLYNRLFGIQHKKAFLTKVELATQSNREMYIVKARSEKMIEPVKMFQDNCNHLMRSWTNGGHAATIVQCNLKNELRPNEKCKQGKTRAFESYAFEHSDTVRRVLGTLIAAFIYGREKGFAQCGMDTIEFTHLYNRFRKIGVRGEHGDFTAWDKHIKQPYVKAAMWLWQQTAGYGSEYDDLFNMIGLDQTHTIEVADGHVFSREAGLHSGSAITTPLNSTINDIVYIMVLLRIIAKHNILYKTAQYELPFKGCDMRLTKMPIPFDNRFILENNDWINYGDDRASVISDQLLPIVNFKSIQESYKFYGILYDSPNKDGTTIHSIPLTELQFLSRTFNYDEQFQSCFPTLKEESRYALLYWTTSHTAEQYYMNLLNVIQEMVLATEDEYNTITDYIQLYIIPYLRSQNIHVRDIPHVTYNIARASYAMQSRNFSHTLCNNATMFHQVQLTSYDDLNDKINMMFISLSSTNNDGGLKSNLVDGVVDNPPESYLSELVNNNSVNGVVDNSRDIIQSKNVFKDTQCKMTNPLSVAIQHLVTEKHFKLNDGTPCNFAEAVAQSTSTTMSGMPAYNKTTNRISISFDQNNEVVDNMRKNVQRIVSSDPLYLYSYVEEVVVFVQSKEVQKLQVGLAFKNKSAGSVHTLTHALPRLKITTNVEVSHDWQAQQANHSKAVANILPQAGSMEAGISTAITEIGDFEDTEVKQVVEQTGAFSIGLWNMNYLYSQDVKTVVYTQYFLATIQKIAMTSSAPNVVAVMDISEFLNPVMKLWFSIHTRMYPVIDVVCATVLPSLVNGIVAIGLTDKDNPTYQDLQLLNAQAKARKSDPTMFLINTAAGVPLDFKLTLAPFVIEGETPAQPRFTAGEVTTISDRFKRQYPKVAVISLTSQQTSNANDALSIDLSFHSKVNPLSTVVLEAIPASTEETSNVNLAVSISGQPNFAVNARLSDLLPGMMKLFTDGNVYVRAFRKVTTNRLKFMYVTPILEDTENTYESDRTSVERLPTYDTSYTLKPVNGPTVTSAALYGDYELSGVSKEDVPHMELLYMNTELWKGKVDGQMINNTIRGTRVNGDAYVSVESIANETFDASFVVDTESHVQVEPSMLFKNSQRLRVQEKVANNVVYPQPTGTHYTNDETPKKACLQYYVTGFQPTGILSPAVASSMVIPETTETIILPLNAASLYVDTADALVPSNDDESESSDSPTWFPAVDAAEVLSSHLQPGTYNIGLRVGTSLIANTILDTRRKTWSLLQGTSDTTHALCKYPITNITIASINQVDPTAIIPNNYNLSSAFVSRHISQATYKKDLYAYQQALSATSKTPQLTVHMRGITMKRMAEFSKDTQALAALSGAGGLFSGLAQGWFSQQQLDQQMAIENLRSQTQLQLADKNNAAIKERQLFNFLLRGYSTPAAAQQQKQGTIQRATFGYNYDSTKTNNENFLNGSGVRPGGLEFVRSSRRTLNGEKEELPSVAQARNDQVIRSTLQPTDTHPLVDTVNPAIRASHSVEPDTFYESMASLNNKTNAPTTPPPEQDDISLQEYNVTPTIKWDTPVETKV